MNNRLIINIVMLYVAIAGIYNLYIQLAGLMPYNVYEIILAVASIILPSYVIFLNNKRFLFKKKKD